MKPEDNIRLFANKNTPATCASARNEAVSHAGQAIDWLKFLDADDLLAPFALSTFRQMTIEDRMQCVGGAQLKVVNGKVMGLQIPKPQLMDRVNPMVPSMCFVRAAAFAKAGGFDNRIGFEEDWDLWLKLRREYGIEGFGIMPQPLCYYTIDEAERAAKRQPSHLVEDPDSKAAEGAEPKMIDVREYLAKVYGIKPDR